MNARIEDLRAAAAVIGNGRVANNITGAGCARFRIGESPGRKRAWRRFLSTPDLSGGLRRFDVFGYESRSLGNGEH